MTRNEVKIALYKEKPIATLNSHSGNNVYMYQTEVSLGKVSFIIPREDMGETPFDTIMPAQLLIRWLSI